MPDYNYITKPEVQSVCRDIGIQDWSKIKANQVDEAEADAIRQIIGGEALKIPLADFKHGLKVELEHGTQFADANITNNHPILTGRIVLAHLKEGLDYYIRLQCMELEMELAKAIAASDLDKSATVYRELAEQRLKLQTRIVEKLS
jgi:hypothetical protein